MQDRAKEIFGNPMSQSTYRKAVKSQKKFIKKFGDDRQKQYPVVLQENQHIGQELGVIDVLLPEQNKTESQVNEKANGNEKHKAKALNNIQFDCEKGLIVGNIRMGFGHYRISMAIASAAKAMGYTPYWMDLNSYKQTTCTKVISAQNDLYSLGSRLSGKSKLFNHFVWEPMNYEGFRKLSYNASDQKNAELMATVFGEVPKEIPVVATHVWPAQAAIHGGMKYVVNAIPDNWPMALHLAEGSVHTVQTHYAYQGYRILNGMKGKEVLNPMPENSLFYTGHYIDHELVANIETDCQARIRRKKEGAPMRFLLTIGGAGAQKEIFRAILSSLLPAVQSKQVALYVNVGDYRNVWEDLLKEVPGMETLSTEHFDDWQQTKQFAKDALEGEVSGIHGFYHSNIFEAVYCTNLLMRSCDVLVTKPSELAFYPVPKLFIKRVGGHEQWGAVHSAEIGDGTLECRDILHTLQMIELFKNSDSLLSDMCEAIMRNKQAGIYDGAYKVVELAESLRKGGTTK